MQKTDYTLSNVRQLLSFLILDTALFCKSMESMRGKKIHVLDFDYKLQS